MSIDCTIERECISPSPKFEEHCHHHQISIRRVDSGGAGYRDILTACGRRGSSIEEQGLVRSMIAVQNEEIGHANLALFDDVVLRRSEKHARSRRPSPPSLALISMVQTLGRQEHPLCHLGFMCFFEKFTTTMTNLAEPILQRPGKRVMNVVRKSDDFKLSSTRVNKAATAAAEPTEKRRSPKGSIAELSPMCRAPNPITNQLERQDKLRQV